MPAKCTHSPVWNTSYSFTMYLARGMIGQATEMLCRNPNRSKTHLVKAYLLLAHMFYSSILSPSNHASDTLTRRVDEILHHLCASDTSVIRIASGHSTKASLNNYFCRFVANFLQMWGFVILQTGPRGPWSIAALVADFLQAGLQIFCRRPGQAEKTPFGFCQWAF